MSENLAFFRKNRRQIGGGLISSGQRFPGVVEYLDLHVFFRIAAHLLNQHGVEALRVTLVHDANDDIFLRRRNSHKLEFAGERNSLLDVEICIIDTQVRTGVHEDAVAR